MKQFIEDKYSIPSLHVSNSQSLNGLSMAGLDKELVESFEEILNTSEIGLYAPGLLSDKQEIFQKTLQLFATLDN